MGLFVRLFRQTLFKSENTKCLMAEEWTNGLCSMWSAEHHIAMKMHYGYTEPHR